MRHHFCLSQLRSQNLKKVKKLKTLIQSKKELIKWIKDNHKPMDAEIHNLQLTLEVEKAKTRKLKEELTKLKGVLETKQVRSLEAIQAEKEKFEETMQLKKMKFEELVNCTTKNAISKYKASP